MIEPDSLIRLRDEIEQQILQDRGVLDTLREEVRPLREATTRIRPRATTSVSVVGADGGNNSLEFDPFLVQLIRVVDSSNNEYCLQAVTPTTDVDRLARDQFDAAGQPATPLAEMMSDLGVSTLPQLSHMIRPNNEGRPVSPSWVQAYRELVEWATLYAIVKNRSFATDTLIVFDGLLRSKVFARENFKNYLSLMSATIEQHYLDSKRRIYLVGVAKHSKVLARYRLAMSLESVLTTTFPSFVEVPRELEERAYVWSEYARGDDREMAEGEVNKFVGGKMFLVKFGKERRDPIWPIDIFLPQRSDASTILGYLLADAIGGFPVPLYPRCLQKAHEHAALVGFDFDILQDQIFDGLRTVLGSEAPLLDVFRLQDVDVSQRRYG